MAAWCEYYSGVGQGRLTNTKGNDMNIFTNFRCVAFPGHRRTNYACAIDAAGNVRVWDDVAGHFTTCHILTDEQKAAIKAKAGKEAKAAGSRHFHSRP